MWGKNDNFAEISIREQKFKTKTHTDGGDVAQWNAKSSTTTMEVADVSEKMTVKIFDEDTTSNDLICEGTIDLKLLCLDSPVQNQWFQLQYKDKPSGKICLSATFTPNQKGGKSDP